MTKPILLIGAMLLDTKGKPYDGLQPGTSNPSRIKHTRGGTARNVAENLALLGADVMLVSAVGDDNTGRLLVGQTAAAGVNVSYVQVVPEGRTGSYIAILNEDGGLSVALDDVAVMDQVSSAYLYQHRRLFRDAGIIMVDGSLTPETLDMAVRLATKYKVPLVADPSSARLASKLCAYLPHLSLVVPNEVEAATLVGREFNGHDPDATLDVAGKLVQMGVEHAIVTMSNYGIAYATTDEVGFIPPYASDIVDTTGTGDALTAAMMFGLYEELPAIEAIRLAAAAAHLTLQTSETVVPNLSLDMLYEHLFV